MAWVKLDDHFDEHEKVVSAGHEAGWLFVRSLAYANRRETDGHIPESILQRIGSDFGPRKRKELAARLVEVGLWHAPGHSCPRCPQPVDGWQIHDYPDYQPTKAKLDAERARARDRMKRAREAKRQDSSADVRGEHGANDGLTDREHRRSSRNPVPDPVPDTRKAGEKDYSSAPSGADKQKRPRKVIPEDSEAYRLAVHLRDAILARDPETKVPENLNGWAIEADRLLRLDKRDPGEATRLIEWCQRDSFWSANILSMATFRKQYDKLKRKAEGQMALARAGPRRRLTDVDLMLQEEGVYRDTG